MATPVATQLNLAHQQYQSGKVIDAEITFRQVIEQEPRHVEALFWLAIIADQQGKIPDSIAYYERVLQIQPDSAEAHGNLGSVLLKVRRLEEAIAHHRKSVDLIPQNAKAHYNLAIALYENDETEAAIAHYQQAVALMPDYANAHHNLGMALYKQGEIDASIQHYRQAVQLEPSHASAFNSLGVALYQQGKLDEAIEQYRAAIALQPNYVSAHDNLGIALKQQGNLEEAAHHFQRAIALKPDYANPYINLGNTWRDLGDYDKAISYCQEAIRLQPDNADAHNSYGCILVDLSRFADAIASFESAVRHRPEFADAHLNLGIILLQTGDFQRGFPEYHWRWKTKQCPDLRYVDAMWRGTDLHGKTILLTAEQGFGDTIQFARYAPLVAARGGEVVIACQKPLLRLLSTVPGVSYCVDRDQDNVEVHAHAPLLELPYILGTTPDTIPVQVPYLSPPTDAQIRLTEFPNTRLKIGFVWATNPSNSTSGKRSCALDDFLTLLAVPDIALYSLQKEAPETDRALLSDRDRLQDLQEQLSDFADTAAAIAQLDLVITVDTAVAHLAGALGKPTWTLLPAVADWRWLVHRDDSPWYPTMRLFRQNKPGDWAEVFGRVIEALAIADNGKTADEPFKTQQNSSPRPASLSPFPAPLTLSGFNRIKHCRHGVFLHNVSDLTVGRSLDLYGEWSEGEIQLFQSLVKLGNTVVEVGAEIGAHTVVLAKAVGLNGKVIAIEPQRTVFQNLCANLALNSIANAYTYQIALGDRTGFVPVSALRSRRRELPTAVGAATPEQVQVATLDSFNLPHCQVLKLNVGDMLEAVLKGAQQTVERCQPILYLVNDQSNSVETIARLKFLDYDLYWHRPALFNPDNFCGAVRNVFGTGTRHNLLGFPRSLNVTVNGMERAN